jgi:predicted permease
MRTLLKDVIYSLRGLAKRPGYTLVAVLTLALGIGANTAIFSGINAILLKSLPFREPDNLMLAYLGSPGSTETEQESQPWSYPKYEVLRDQNRSFEQVAAFSKQDFSLTDTETPERLTGEIVSASYFPLLGLNARQGRVFGAEEDARPKDRPVVVISHGLWQRRFGSDANIIGRRIFLDKITLEVVGVMPEGFRGLSGAAELWIPTMMAPALLAPDQLTEPFVHWHDVVARLKPGLPREQAQAEMKSLAQTLNEAVPAPPGFESGDINIVPLREAKVDPTIKKSFLILFVAVVFVLLIACVNSANLLLARSLSRQKEIAIRLALGARRSHIIRLLLIESSILGLLGGLFGLLLAIWGTNLLNVIRPANNPAEWARNFQILDFNVATLDASVLIFNFVVAITAGLLFGLLPAIRASRPDVNSALKDVATGPAESFGRFRGLGPVSLLVIAEVALSLVLLAGAGLMLRSFQTMQHTDIGFDPKNILTMKFDLSKLEPPAANAFIEQLLARVSALPGVRSASVSQSTPLSDNAGKTELNIVGRPPGPPGSGPAVDYHVVGGEHFKTLAVPVVKGRTFTERDRADAPRVAVINEHAARLIWPGEDPLGKRIMLSLGWSPDQAAEIVGVVGDVKYHGVEEPVNADVYLSYLQDGQRPNFILARTTGDPASLTQQMRREVLALNKDMPVYDVKTMEERVAAMTSRTRLSALLLGLFAGVALLLSSIGVYSMTSYAVSERTKEFGIRMALGASPQQIFRLVLRRGVLVAGIGIVGGLLAAFALTRVLASQLYGVSSTDPLTFLGVSLLHALVALLACYVPARRVTRLDPMIAFKHQ